MRRALIVTVSSALLLLSWAALDDITTGSEPSHTLESIVVSPSIVWFAGLIAAKITRQD